MPLFTFPNSEIIDQPYECFVHRVVQTSLQHYRTKKGRNPKFICLNHEEALALIRWAFHLVNKKTTVEVIEKCNFAGIDIKIMDDAPHLFIE